MLNSAQIVAPATPSKQAQTRGLKCAAVITHNFFRIPLDYEYYYDYDDSDDYYYEHLQEVRI